MINPVGLAGFCLLNAVSPDNETPERASRPFDATRNGFVLGEGAGFLVLEEWEAARRRGARIYAELAGDGNSLSSYRITDSHPSGDGPIQAMRQALRDAGASLDAVDYLNAHGTSTPMNDRSECAALRVVFGDGFRRVAVSSTKSVMGHLIAAAGAVEAAVCALAIRDGSSRQCEPAGDRPGLRRRHRARRAAQAPRPHRHVQLARLRGLEQLPRVPQPRGSRRPPGDGRVKSMAKAQRIVVTGLGAVCGAGKSPDEILDALYAGRSAIAPITQWDASKWPARVAAEVPDYNAAVLAGDRKLLKLIRRTDVFGLYAAGRAIEAAGLMAYRDALDAAAAATFSDATGVYVGSGGGGYQSQYEYFPLLTAAAGNLHTLGH
jgi:3-oxoacyl-(acyl-carrier-protein) synthase